MANSVSMSQSIAGRYAQAVFDLAREAGDMDRLSSEIDDLGAALANSDALRDTLAQKSGKKVKLNTRVDEGLIGGMIVKLGSQMIDSSVRSKLASLQNTMKEVG